MSEQKLYLISHHETEARWKTRNTGMTPTEYPADYYKIGVSTTPKRRLSMLNGGTPHQLRLQSVIDSDDAKRVEEILHKVYSFNAQTGEWFKLTSNAVNSLVALDRINVDEMESVGGYRPTWLVEDGTNLYLEIMEHRKDVSSPEVGP